MKFTIYLFLLLPLAGAAECTKSQENNEIPLVIEVVANGIKAGGNHGYMDKIIIKTPQYFEGVPLVAMELTEGEVANFWIPLSFVITNGVAQASFSGHKESIKKYEIAVYYENESCSKSVQRMVYAYNKSHQPDAAKLRG